MDKDKVLETTAEKTRALIDSAIAHCGGTPNDLQKNTPLGLKIKAVAEEAARNLAVSTGDKSFQRIARNIRRSMGGGAKPVGEFDTK